MIFIQLELFAARYRTAVEIYKVWELYVKEKAMAMLL